LGGDHSLCDASRCDAARRADYDPPDGELHPASMTAVTLKALAELPFSDSDPRFVIATLVLKLSAIFDVQPSTLVSAEIRRNLDWLASHPDASPDILDGLRARIAVKQIAALEQAAIGQGTGLLAGSHDEAYARLREWKPAN
jgi:hypothetical protein